MKASFKPKKILWVDLEMTGLDPIHDEILEVAAIVTDWKFNEIATYEGVVRHDAKKLKELLDKNASFWDEHPDARRGLEQQNAHGKSLQEVEQELLVMNFVKMSQKFSLGEIQFIKIVVLSTSGGQRFQSDCIIECLM